MPRQHMFRYPVAVFDPLISDNAGRTKRRAGGDRGADFHHRVIARAAPCLQFMAMSDHAYGGAPCRA